MVYHAYRSGPFEMACITEPGAVPTESLYYQTQAQEYKIVHYKWEAKHVYNRKSGRYIHSEVSCSHDDETRHDGIEYRSLPKLSKEEITEARR
jgi:hypothetical protein